MSRPEGNESVSLSGPDFTELPELCIIPRDAKFDDLGAMAHIFIKSFKGDKTAQLLHPLDSTWPEVVDMLNKYLVDANTHLILAEDEYSKTIVGWTSVSLVLPDVEDYFKCGLYFPTRIYPVHHVRGAGDLFRLPRHVF